MTNYQSYIKVTHIPTGIYATCNHLRGQHRNKSAALELVRARLYAERYVERVDVVVRYYDFPGNTVMLPDTLLDEIGK